LHNVSIFKKLNLHARDEISVYKANQIIPQIKDNLSGGKELISIPTHCPCCGYPTETRCDKESEVLYCVNPNCTAKLIQRLVHYCSRNAMNIEGLSEKTLELFVKLGFIKDILDIYFLQLHKDKIIKLEGFGIRSYEKLINSILKSKQCKLSNFIFALGIPNVGKSTSKDICNYFNNDWYTVINSAKKDLLKIDGIGEVVTDSFDRFFQGDNLVLMCELKEILTFEANEPKHMISNTDNPLYGLHVYPTGKFTLKKEALKVELQKLGAIVENGYKKSLHYLVCGNDMSKSSKDKKAIDDGVKIMTEDELMNVINHN